MIIYEKNKTEEQEKIKEKLDEAAKEIVGLASLDSYEIDNWNKVLLRKKHNELETIAEFGVSNESIGNVAIDIDIIDMGYYHKKLKQALEKSRFKWKVYLI